MPPGVVENNQADFQGRYRPIDAARYNTEQSQAHYERMRSEINERSKSLLQGNQGIHTSGAGSSMYNVGGSGRHEPKRREYRTKARRDRAYTRDVVERTMQAPMNFYDAFNEFGAEFGVSEPVDRFTSKHVFGGAMGMTGIKKMGHGMLAGGAAGYAAYLAAEGSIQYSGIREGFNQFGEIKKLRGASRPMTAGTASGPNGRMNREMAANVLNDMSEEARLNNMQREGETLSDMKEQAGILADYQLLEGNRSADEFEKTFKRLKEGVKKVMEVMGTTFEEGTKLMKDFRNAGINPTRGVNMINQGRLTSAQFGNNFQEGHASGMKSAMAMRGTGFSMGAGYQMGQYASGMAQTIYEGNYLDDKTMYNVGGQRGVQQELQRSSMRFMESPQFTSMMMAAQGEGGQLNEKTVMQTLAGNRGSADNAAAASRNMSSLEDILSFRANNRGQISNMIANNPGLLQGLQVQSVMDMARRTGNDPEEMTRGQLAEFAGMTGMMTADQFRVQASSLEALPETLGRREQERRRTSESRSRDMYRTGLMENIMEDFRESPGYRAIAEGSASAARGTREAIYDASRSISNTLSRKFSGTTTITASGEGVSILDSMEEAEGYTGGIRSDPNDLLSTSDEADQLEQFLQSDANDIETVSIPNEQIFDDGMGDRSAKTNPKEGMSHPLRGSENDRFGVTLTEKQMKRLGINPENVSDDRKEYRGNKYFSSRELAERDIIGAEGDPEVEQNIGKHFINESFDGFTAQFDPTTGRQEYPHKFEEAAVSLIGAKSRVLLGKVDRVEENVAANRNLANTIKEIREGQSEDPTVEGLSEEGASAYETFFAGSIDRDRIRDIRNKTGADGVQEISTYYQELLKDKLGLEGKTGSPELKRKINKRLEEKPALAEGFGHLIKQTSQMGLEQENREFTTFLQAGEMGKEAMKAHLDDASSIVNEATDEVFEGWRDPAIENKLDSSTNARDLLVVKAKMRKEGLSKSDLSDQEKEKLERLKEQTGLKATGELPELTTKFIEQAKEKGKKIDDFASSLAGAGELGLISGSGEQTVQSQGMAQKAAETGSEQRTKIEDKLLEVARILRGMKSTVDRMQTVQKKIVEDSDADTGGYGPLGN